MVKLQALRRTGRALLDKPAVAPAKVARRDRRSSHLTIVGGAPMLFSKRRWLAGGAALAGLLMASDHRSLRARPAPARSETKPAAAEAKPADGTPPVGDWKLERITLDDGKVLQGLIESEGPSSIEFVEVRRPRGKPMFLVVRPIDRKLDR